MRLIYFLFFFGCFSLVSYTQTYEGVVYGNIGTLEGVIIKNLRTKNITSTDSEGQFIIDGKEGDSLSFQFFTYEDRKLVLQEKNTKDFVVELTKKVNTLDEVYIEQEIKFKEDKFQKNYESDIARHIRLYPEQYEYNNNPNANINFVNIGKRLWKLIRKNKPPKRKQLPKIDITLEEYISLFKKDPVINDTFMVETLNIPLKKKPLFIDFCISQRLDSILLNGENRFLLMDELINISKQFLLLPSSGNDR